MRLLSRCRQREGSSLPFDAINRNKASLATALRAPAGLAMQRMAGTADVPGENYEPRPGEKLGLEREKGDEGQPQARASAGDVRRADR
jgi:crotonobetainyl-CoA:carnitine CoA-transferase CaiB-like acyl-CoA transferase